jgi:hypothetical protein
MTSVTSTTDTNANLLLEIKNFVTATLPVAERWVQMRYDTSVPGSEELILKGVGAGGTDEIYVGLKCYTNTELEIYCIKVTHFIGYNSSLPFEQQPGIIDVFSNWITLPLNNNPGNTTELKYWLIGNSRHFKVVVRVGTVYHQCYLGFIIPYANPTEWPYPICTGGSGLIQAIENGIPTTFNDISIRNTAFWTPRLGNSLYNGASNFFNNGSTLCVREASGINARIFHRTSFESPGYIYEDVGATLPFRGTWPYVEDWKGQGPQENGPTDTGSAGGYFNVRTDLGGNYNLMPIMIINDTPASILGEFDGMRYITGYNNNTEDIITIGAQNWLVMQDVFRTSSGSFCAYLLN